MLSQVKGYIRYARAGIVRMYREINQNIQDRRRDRALVLLFYSRGESEVALNSLIEHALGRRATPMAVIDLAKEMVGQDTPDWVDQRMFGGIDRCPK